MPEKNYWDKGQIILVMCMTLVIVIISVATIIYLTSTHHLFFNYNPSREIILSIDADFERALTRILANATAQYNKTRSEDVYIDEMKESRKIANITFSYWFMAMQAAYAGKGVNIEADWMDDVIQGEKDIPIRIGWVRSHGQSGFDDHIQHYTTRTLENKLVKLFWYRPNSISAIGSRIKIDSVISGIVGWESAHMILLNLTITSIWSNEEKGEVYINVVVLKEGGKPVNDLKKESFELYWFDPSAPLGKFWWRIVEEDEITLTYNGGGNYTLTFKPDFWDKRPQAREKRETFWKWGDNPGYYQFVIIRVKDSRDIIVEAYSYAGIEYVIRENAIESTGSSYKGNPAKTKEKYVFELLPNGTIYWFGTPLTLENVPPVPFPPVKQLRVFATINYDEDPDSFVETPYQIEIWDDRYLWPSSTNFLGWRKRFMNGSKLVFEVNYPPGCQNQKVRITWLDDCDAQPPEYRIEMIISQGLGRVDTGKYIFYLVVDPEEYGSAVGGHIDWCFSLRKREGGSESWVDSFLLGYNATRPSDTGPCVLPNKIPGGDWTILPTPRDEEGVLIAEAPVRIIAYRRSNIVTTVPAPESFNMVEPGEPPQPGRPSPGPREVTNHLYHETFIYLPYDVSYVLITVNATWLSDVTMDKYRAYLGLIGMIGPPHGSDSNRVQWGSLMTGDGTIVNGSFGRNYDDMMRDYIDHRGRGWGLRYSGAPSDDFLVDSGREYGYWASLYRNGFGVAIFASESFMNEMDDYVSQGVRRDRLWVWTNPLGSRRFMEYDAIGWDSRSSKGWTFQQNDRIQFKAAVFIIEGGEPGTSIGSDNSIWNRVRTWYNEEDPDAGPFSIVNNPPGGVVEDIELYSRAAFIVEDFSEDPFESGRLIKNTDAWQWSQDGYVYVSTDGSSGSWGGMHIAYSSSTITSGNDVFILARIKHSVTSSGQHVGLTMISPQNYFYTLEYWRGTGSNRRLRMYKYTTSWSNPLPNQLSINLPNDIWFIFLGKKGINSGSMTLTLFNDNGAQQGTVSNTDNSPLTTNRVGIGIRDENQDGNYLSAYFDYLIVSVDVDPSKIIVRGLGSGWRVIIRDSSGREVSAVASSGIATLNVPHMPIIRNGKIIIRDGGGNEVFSKLFDLIVGGDVYVCRVRGSALNAADESNMYYKMFLESYVPTITYVGAAYENPD
ncbi:MAG: hypothetical protein QXS51_03275 [Thermoproteota archaeon]